MQPRNEKFFSFAGKARTPSSAPPFSREVVAPRERWGKLAKWTTAELHGRRSPNRPAPKRTAPRHPARVTQIVARLSRRTNQILVPCAAYTGQRRRPATPLERHPARS
jgi:hypothetical protein